MVVDTAAYYLAYDALTHDGPASMSRFNKASCIGLQNNTMLHPKLAVGSAKSMALDLYRLFTHAQGDVSVEPPIKVSICGDQP